MHEFKAEGQSSLNALQSVTRRASLAVLVICGATVHAEAGRIDGSQLGTAAPIPTLKCPPKIVPKCKPGEKPYCAEFSGKCCRAVGCRKTK
jgi:hypothetical protein